jgi:hypothetical protein
VYEAELAIRMRAAKLAVSLHCRSTVRARLNDANAIENAVVVRAVRLERFNDEPLVGMRCADLGPPHATTLTGRCDSGQFFAIADGRRWVDFALPRRALGSEQGLLPT